MEWERRLLGDGRKSCDVSDPPSSQCGMVLITLRVAILVLPQTVWLISKSVFVGANTFFFFLQRTTHTHKEMLLVFKKEEI